MPVSDFFTSRALSLGKMFSIITVIVASLLVFFVIKGDELVGGLVTGFVITTLSYATTASLIILVVCFGTYLFYKSPTLILVAKTSQTGDKGLSEFLIVIKQMQDMFNYMNTVKPTIRLDMNFLYNAVSRNIQVPGYTVGINDMFNSISQRALHAVSLGENRAHYICYLLASLGLKYRGKEQNIILSRGVALKTISDAISAIPNANEEYLSAGIPENFRQNFLNFAMQVQQQIQLTRIHEQSIADHYLKNPGAKKQDQNTKAD